MSEEGFYYQEDYRPHPTMEGVMLSFQGFGVQQMGDKIEFFLEDGDKGGRGAEHRSIGFQVPFEEARRLVEFLHPILYGEDE